MFILSVSTSSFAEPEVRNNGVIQTIIISSSTLHILNHLLILIDYLFIFVLLQRLGYSYVA